MVQTNGDYLIQQEWWELRTENRSPVRQRDVHTAALRRCIRRSVSAAEVRLLFAC